MMGQRMKGVKFMEYPPYEPVQNKNELGFISVSANISIDIDQEGEERQLQAKAFFDPMFWEIELVCILLIPNHRTWRAPMYMVAR